MDTSNSRTGTIQIPLSRSAKHRSEIDLAVDASQIPHLCEDITGKILVVGTAITSGNHVTLSLSVTATARLVCDRSLEEFDEPLHAELDLEFSIDNQLAAEQRQMSLTPEPDVVRGIREDEIAIDVTEDVRQELTLLIPMKKVAPQYRDVELSNISPGYAGRKPQDTTENEIQDQWVALKNLKNL